jgi:hypothetical protein
MQTIIIIIQSIVYNSLYLLFSNLSRTPSLVIKASLEAGGRGPGTCTSFSWLAVPSFGGYRESFPSIPRLPPFFSGLDHDSFIKTQREMGLLRVLLGKNYFVFLMTFLSSSAKGP